MELPVGSTSTNTITYSASTVNSFRISAVMDRLQLHVQPNPRSDPDDFLNLCISLARGIDYAVANGEIPLVASDLPLLLKQVYQRKNEFSLQPVIMMLLISIKGACRSGWFMDKDAEELRKLTNEIGSIFQSEDNIHTEPSNVIPIISDIMARFYPLLEIGNIIVSLQVKPGFGTYMTDFNILKGQMNPKEMIYLFVAQTDNTETSSCIASPPQVSFLLNGKGVEKRTNDSMENGPQLPTNVTSMLKYGSNLLQAFGNFDGTCIIAVVFMGVTSSSNTPLLQDYVRPLLSAENSDSDITEGSSRISLNCPISLKRIKTPVKGHLCKHHQCFDYDNFIEINLRRPSWHCPLCGQSVSYIDIRIDQFMVKVLQEAGESSVDVFISADGSWKTTPSCSTKSNGNQQEFSKLSRSSKSTAFIMDLTTDEMDVTWEMEERKPHLDTLPGLFSETTTQPLGVNNNALEVVDPFSDHQIENGLWSGMSSVCSPFGISQGNSDSLLDHSLMPSTPTTVSLSPHQIMVPSSHLATSQIENAIVHSDLGRSAIMRNVTRIPVAVQALAAPATPNLHQQPSVRSFNPLTPYQTQFSSQFDPTQTAPISHQWSSTGLNPLIPNLSPPVASVQALPAQTLLDSCQRSSTNLNSFMPSPVASQTPLSIPKVVSGFAIGGTLDRQPQFVNYHANPLSTSDATSSSMQHNLIQQHYFPMTQPQSMVGQLSTQFSYNRQTPDSGVRPAPIMVGPSSSFPHQQAPHLRVSRSTPTPSSINAQLPATSAQRSSTMARVLPVKPVQLQPAQTRSSLATGFGGKSRTSNQVQAVTRTEDLVGPLSAETWCPQKRMRGSLSGRAIPDSLSQLIIQPTQSAPQSVRNPHELISQPSGNNLQFQTSMNLQRPQPQGIPRTTGDGPTTPGSRSFGVTH